MSDSQKDAWHTLINFEALEHWRQDSHYIVGSYRKTANSYRKSYASIFKIHNETVNIWSHLIPALLSMPIALGFYYHLQSRYERASKGDVVAIGCFFLGALCCLGMSATFVVKSPHIGEDTDSLQIPHYLEP